MLQHIDQFCSLERKSYLQSFDSWFWLSWGFWVNDGCRLGGSGFFFHFLTKIKKGGVSIQFFYVPGETKNKAYRSFLSHGKWRGLIPNLSKVVGIFHWLCFSSSIATIIRSVVARDRLSTSLARGFTGLMPEAGLPKGCIIFLNSVQQGLPPYSSPCRITGRA